MVEVYVEKVYGCCAVCVEGDKMVYGSTEILLDQCEVSGDLPLFKGSSFKGGKSGVFCPIAMNSLYPYISAMGFGISAVDMGIAESGEDGYVICPAWGPPHCEALVIYRLHPVPIEKCGVDAWYEYLAKMGHVAVPSYFLETFASEETKDKRKHQVEEWLKMGKPKFWEGWRNPPCQPRRKK
ncbi:MAG: hypothetical protein ACOY40_01270 [Bacillota bacterium]